MFASDEILPPDPEGLEVMHDREYRVRDARDVEEVLDWARARSKEWAVYIELATEADSLAAARIAGIDPTQGEAFTVRAEL